MADKKTGAVKPASISEEQIIEKWFGCEPKYIRKRGTSLTIDVTGMAYDGKTLKKGLLDG